VRHGAARVLGQHALEGFERLGVGHVMEERRRMVERLLCLRLAGNGKGDRPEGVLVVPLDGA
jgi:hypothetical protein